jgi:hypothetical protein
MRKINGLDCLGPASITTLRMRNHENSGTLKSIKLATIALYTGTAIGRLACNI